MPWTTVDFADEIEAIRPILEIQKGIEFLKFKGELTPDWAIFARRERVGVGISLFFSPSAQAFSAQFGARVCETPSVNLAFFAGHPDALDALKFETHERVNRRDESRAS
jgi:hypothetical protein